MVPSRLREGREGRAGRACIAVPISTKPSDFNKLTNRKFFIGVDEAGYGPNLGPLVIAGSLWSAPTDCTEQLFTQAFQSHFGTTRWSTACQHVPLDDSKKLYSSRGGLATLEAGLLAMLHLLPPGDTLKPGVAEVAKTFGASTSTAETLGDFRYRSLGDVVDRLVCPELVAELAELAWYTNYPEQAVPVALDISEAQRLSRIAHASLASHGIELVDMHAAVICEPHFNRVVAQTGSKGELLSRTTLDLVVRLLDICSVTSSADSSADSAARSPANYSAATEVFCDRQGGRKNYLPNLMAALPERWFAETQVSPQRSSYHSSGEPPLTVHFSVGGDSFPPTALASMLAKYLRERLMGELNGYWRQFIPDLKSTAGYPVDARRFRNQIERLAQREQFSLDRWWRSK